MPRHEGSRCALALLALLCPVTTAGGRGPPECLEKAVAAGGKLQLRLEEPHQGWININWRVTWDSGGQHRILTAERDKDAASDKGPLTERAVFQQETLSLQISPISRAESGVYKAEFEDTSGSLSTQCFHVSVWDPVPVPQLEVLIPHWEPSGCNLSLVCKALGASNISYGWSCAGDPLGDLEPQPQLHLRVHGDTNPTVCSCNVSNPASWSTTSIDTAAACHAAATGFFTTALWWLVAVFLGLALAVSVALGVTCYWRRKRKKDPRRAPPEHVEQTVTIYEEVGKVRTSRTPNENSEAAAGGNTIYSVICPKTPPQELQSSTVYSTVHPKKCPSLKTKRLDPALVSTAYAEATGVPRRWCPPSRALPPVPASHHLS